MTFYFLFLAPRTAGEWSAFCSTVADCDVQIAVVNRGSGIPEATLPHGCGCFDRLYQGQEPLQGIGFGLGSVKQIVDAHRGQREIRSCLGQGTSVVICLPFVNLSPASLAKTFRKNVCES
ncbi:sensor histidine kinase [Thermosynechococcus vestitus]|uniref:sensor histidine kinase n=1 Tax=Thermosynechococcus vestitus TaxID=146786 RepID=UPI0013E8B6EA